MTYHPKSILLCCLFLACKSDHFYLSLRRFIDGVDPDNESGVTEDDVKAPEFLLLQGLRFTLEVRHPMRALQGGVADMLRLLRSGDLSSSSEKDIGKAADKVKLLLKRDAQMTDVYFLYTPSQIWLGALYAINPDLTRHYLDAKYHELSDNLSDEISEKITQTISSCAKILLDYRSPEDDKVQRKEMNRIGKKLIACQNPEKLDIVAVAKAKAAEKREGESGSEAELKKLKKRKLERERMKRDEDVFGGDLKGATTIAAADDGT
jgi:cyclin H